MSSLASSAFFKNKIYRSSYCKYPYSDKLVHAAYSTAEPTYNINCQYKLVLASALRQQMLTMCTTTETVFKEHGVWDPMPDNSPYLIVNSVDSYNVKKKDREFPVPSRDVTTKLSLGGNNDVTTELFLPRGSLVSAIPTGDGKLVNLFTVYPPPLQRERGGVGEISPIGGAHLYVNLQNNK
jgi:hypothetical protein